MDDAETYGGGIEAWRCFLWRGRERGSLHFASRHSGRPWTGLCDRAVGRERRLSAETSRVEWNSKRGSAGNGGFRSSWDRSVLCGGDPSDGADRNRRGGHAGSPAPGFAAAREAAFTPPV